MNKKIWRLVLTGENDAFFNMAVDEVLMESVRQGTSLPTLRFYGWQPPAISLGYHQKIKEVVDLEKCRKAGIEVVRRPTGGRAVYHEKELTYSIVATTDSALFSKSILKSYLVIAGAFVEGLKHLGVKAEIQRRPVETRHGVSLLCFSTPSFYEVMVAGKKILGSAQRRINGVLLQQGSLLLAGEQKNSIPFLGSNLSLTEIEEKTATVERLLQRKVSFDEVKDALVEGFSEKLSVEFVVQDLTKLEKERVDFLKWRIKNENI
ncbi:MAG: lipoate--protein ligase family protein [Candidatus Edwardsbacteria bacterium]